MNTPYPPNALAVISDKNTPVKVCTATASRRTVADISGNTHEVDTTELQPFTLERISEAAKHAASSAIAVHTVGALSTIRTTPATSSAIVAIRAFQSSALPISEFTTFVAAYALKVAAEGNLDIMSSLFCTIAQTLMTSAEEPTDCVCSIACMAWCAEACKTAGEDMSSHYIAPVTTSDSSHNAKDGV
tara:strand:+ start:1357 stop:1920 length:564 start_codon:yes stop_codon:yes gene_type:complete